MNPPILVATSPWEQVLVIWLGIPLLATSFAIYPSALLFACQKFPVPRALMAQAACSATLYATGFAAGFFAWRLGSLGWLLRLLQLSQETQVLSVARCFELLAASTLGTAVVLQIPILLLHAWRARAERLRPTR